MTFDSTLHYVHRILVVSHQPLTSITAFPRAYPHSQNWSRILCLFKTLAETQKRCLFIAIIPFSMQRSLTASHWSLPWSRDLSFTYLADASYFALDFCQEKTIEPTDTSETTQISSERSLTYVITYQNSLFLDAPSIAIRSPIWRKSLSSLDYP